MGREPTAEDKMAEAFGCIICMVGVGLVLIVGLVVKGLQWAGYLSV